MHFCVAGGAGPAGRRSIRNENLNENRKERPRQNVAMQVVLGRLVALLAAPLKGLQAGAAPEEPRFSETVAIRARIALLQVTRCPSSMCCRLCPCSAE